MLKLIKYLWFASIYKKIKKDSKIILISLAALPLTTYIATDIMPLVSGTTLHLVLLLKWVIVLSLLALIAQKLINIIQAATNPLLKEKPKENKNSVKTAAKNSKKNEANPSHKERLMQKETLRQKRDLVLQKYKNKPPKQQK